MSEYPEWIPNFIELDEYGGDWREYLEAVYKYFCDELVYNKAVFKNADVGVRRIPETDGKGFGFWHCISEGKKEESRIPDLDRCKRIRWIRAVIDNYQEPQVDYWQNERGREKCHLLWYDETYLVVLAERHNKQKGNRYYLLKTAYCTFGEKRKAALRKERDAYYKSRRRP